MKYKPFREMYFAIKTKKYAPDLTLFEYWLWRILRKFRKNHPRLK
jgi:hypothetical protein